MTNVTETHEERETLTVEVNIPGHDPRTTTALFRHTKQLLIEREGGRCFVCGRTAEQSGHPLEAHHHPIERSLTNMIDWQRFEADCHAGLWGAAAKAFDWEKFWEGATVIEVPAWKDPESGEEYPAGTVQVPADPMLFVDDMTVNGELLCADHHRGKDEGKHALPFPIWIAQRYAVEGYKFSDVEIIHHEG